MLVQWLVYGFGKVDSDSRPKSQLHSRDLIEDIQSNMVGDPEGYLALENCLVLDYALTCTICSHQFTPILDRSQARGPATISIRTIISKKHPRASFDGHHRSVEMGLRVL